MLQVLEIDLFLEVMFEKASSAPFPPKQNNELLQNVGDINMSSLKIPVYLV